MKNIYTRLLTPGALLMLCSSMAIAATETLDINGVASCDEQGAACNTIIDVDLGPGAVLTGIGWDVTISTNGASWFSEAVISYGPDTGDPAFFDLTPGSGDISGEQFFSSGGIVDLGTDFPLDNGILRLEFWESFVDFTGSPDAYYVDPSLLTFQFDPGEITADIDIKFCSDPNAFNCKQNGVLPVTIFGSDSLDVGDIDLETLQLCTEDLSACTNPPRDWSIADRGNPITDLGAAQCAIVEVDDGVFEEQDYLNMDGHPDLDAAFEASEVKDILGTFCDQAKNTVSAPLVIIGSTVDGTPISSVAVPSVAIDQLLKVNR